jgi:hypothetical protein
MTLKPFLKYLILISDYKLYSCGIIMYLPHFSLFLHYVNGKESHFSMNIISKKILYRGVNNQMDYIQGSERAEYE